MIFSRNEVMNTPVNPIFHYMKWSFQGCSFHRLDNMLKWFSFCFHELQSHAEKSSTLNRKEWRKFKPAKGSTLKGKNLLHWQDRQTHCDSYLPSNISIHLNLITLHTCTSMSWRNKNNDNSPNQTCYTTNTLQMYSQHASSRHGFIQFFVISTYFVPSWIYSFIFLYKFCFFNSTFHLKLFHYLHLNFWSKF